MADLYGSQDVTIRNDDGTKIVTIITDGSYERLAACTLNMPHQKIHDGQRFFCNRYASGLSNGTNYDLSLVTSTAKVHLRMDARWLATGRIEVYEGATLSNNGTALTVYNRSRDVAGIGTMLAYHTPTVTTTGTLIFVSIHTAAVGIHPFIDTFDNELILKVSTKYLIRMASTSGSNAYSITYDWYEV